MTPLTPDDCLLIELLVDGELEDEKRKELLRRMDRIVDGWRHCAVAFLQSQLFTQSCRHYHSETSNHHPDILFSDNTAFLSHNTHSVVNISSSPPVLRSSKNKLFMVLASGFLLTAILGAVVLTMKYHSSADSATAIALSPVALAPGAPMPNDMIQDSAGPIRMITLKSPNKELDGISVPCVETTHYSSEIDLQRNDRNTTFVNDLRNRGHRVETVHEDLMFPLKDGRSLILPVDTFNVQYRDRKQYQ